MSGAESYAFGPDASNFDQRPYGEQSFDPALFSQEFARRQQRFGEFITGEVRAFRLHQNITRELVSEYGEPQYLPREDGSFYRMYQEINYDPDPSDSDQRRFIKVGERITSQGVVIPNLSVSRPAERQYNLPPEAKFNREAIKLVHDMLQGKAPAKGARGYADAFMSQSSHSLWTETQLATQKGYTGWLEVVAKYIGVRPAAPVMTPFISLPMEQISPN